MEDFTISLAEIPIGVKPLSSGLQSCFTAYLSDESPRFIVALSEKDLEYERRMTDKRIGKDSVFSPRSALNLEATALLRLIANRIPEYDVILFHGSAVAVDGKAYLFAAQSGTGKTTHSRLWLQQLPQAYILNGDKPFLKADSSGRILVCGTPWRGKETLGCNEIMPLEAICILEQAEKNHICSITPKEASEALLHQIYFPENGVGILRAITLLDRISREIRLYRLGCNMEPEAAQLSIRAMIPGRTC